MPRDDAVVVGDREQRPARDEQTSRLSSRPPGLAQCEHVVPIPGTKKTAYLEQNAASATVELSTEDPAELDALPAPVGARY